MVKTILILEDDVRLAMQWDRVLTGNDFIVYVTHGAIEAVEIFDTHEIDLCIVDFMVHEEGRPSPNGGLSFLGMLGASGRKKTKILGVSGMTHKYSAVNAKQFLLTFGAEDFLGKPFSDDELLQQVDRMLG